MRLPLFCGAKGLVHSQYIGHLNPVILHYLALFVRMSMTENFSNVAFHEHLGGKEKEEQRIEQCEKGQENKVSPQDEHIWYERDILAEQNSEKSGGAWSLSACLKVAYASTRPSFNGYSLLFCLNQGELWNTVLGLKCTIYLGIVLNKVCVPFHLQS